MKTNTRFKAAFMIAALFGTLQNASGQSWLITGNAGTTGKNFIGTTDAAGFKIRTNNAVRISISSDGKVGMGINVPAFKLDVKGGSINTDSLYRIGGSPVLSINGSNTFVGPFSGFSNTFGYNNTATGNGALYHNTDGANNTANGVNVLLFNNSGHDNTATGSNSLLVNSTGNYNTANGAYTLVDATTASSNTAIGYQALRYNQNGNYNTALGTDALNRNTTGLYNTACGVQALFFNNGTANTATGLNALYNNTTASNNTAHGYDALFSNTTGTANTANGTFALYKNTGNSQNTAIGYNSLFNTTASDGNTALGYRAGDAFNNGYYNCFIGSETNANGADYFNTIALGHGTLVTAPNMMRVGNGATTSIGGPVGWSNLSDGRVKKNMKENVPGLAFINKLKPVTYNFDLEAADRIVQPVIKDKDGRTVQLSQQEVNARKQKEQIVYTGFVAQDVEKAAKEIGYDFSGVDAAKNEKDLYGLRYADFVVPLVKAVQELSADKDEKNAIILQQQTQIEELKSEVAQIKALLTTALKTATIISNSAARLDQNIPNPGSSSTLIKYYVPNSFQNVQLVITDGAGKTITRYRIAQTGEGEQTINTKAFASGTYQYSLYANDKLIASKKMIIAK